MYLLVFFILGFSLSLIINLFMIVFSKKTQLFIDKVEKNHSSHKIPTPRIGGLGIFISFFILSFFLGKTALLLAISTIPVFLVGFWEDLKGNIPPKKRMLIMSISVVLSIIFLKTIVFDISIAILPIFLAVPFTIFAVVGVTNAINMIDGYNGLASGISIMALSFMAYLSYYLDDFELTFLILNLIFIILGFFVLNFPKGKIFLGDSGSYTLGFMIGIISLILLQRHPEVSPWFPVVLLAYPIFDVLFAIFRRVFIQKTSPFSPDKLHMHSLIYENITKNNPLTSVLIILLSFPFSYIAIYFYNSNQILSFIFLIFASFYVILYILIKHKYNNINVISKYQ